MSGPLKEKESTRLTDSEIDKQINILFDEAIKPYSYGEIMQKAETKGLFRKASQYEVAAIILSRISSDIMDRMDKNDQKVSNS